MSDLISTVQDKDWREGRITVNPVETGSVIDRVCPNVEADKAPAIMTALQTTTPITDPVIDGQPVTGTFAVTSHQSRGQDDRSVTITQTLTKVALTAPDTAAIITSGSNPTIAGSGSAETGLNPGHILQLEWRQINPASVQTIIADRRDASGYPIVTDPVLEGVTYEGAYARGVIVQELQSDNTVVLRERLTRVTQLNAVDGPTAMGQLAALAPVFERGKAKVNGQSIAAWEAETSTLTLAFPWLDEQNETTCLTLITEALFETLVNVTAPAAGVWLQIPAGKAFELQDRVFDRDEETNVGTLRLTYALPDMNAFDSANTKESGRSSAYGTADDQEAVGTNGSKTLLIRGVDVDDIVTAVQTAFGDETHIIGNVTTSDSGPELTVQVTLRRQFTHKTDDDEPTVTKPDGRHEVTALDRRPASYTFTWTRVPAANVTDVEDAARDPRNYATDPDDETTVDGVLYWGVLDAPLAVLDDLRTRDNGDNTYSVTASLRIPLITYSVTSGDDDDDWYETDFELHKVSAKPTGGSSSTLPDVPADTFYWRWVGVRRRIKIYELKNSNLADKWVRDDGIPSGKKALIGSKTEMIGGVIKATKVVDRYVGDWSGATLQSATGAMPTDWAADNTVSGKGAATHYR